MSATETRTETTAQTQDLLIDISDRVMTLTMNRPDKLNALSGEMIVAAVEALRRAATDTSIGAVMLTGAGRAFCAGGDVSGMSQRQAADEPPTMEQNIDRLRASHEFPWLLYSLPKPVIAAVNGHAVGAGLGIALSCDIRYASDKAKFGAGYAKVGLGGDLGTTWGLARLAGPARAKELFFTSDVIEAAEAERIGLINRIFPADTLLAETRKIAEQIASGPSVSYRYMKENINLSMTCDFREMLDRESITHTRCGQTEDHKEGVKAFMEKRKANYRGR